MNKEVSRSKKTFLYSLTRRAALLFFLLIFSVSTAIQAVAPTLVSAQTLPTSGCSGGSTWVPNSSGNGGACVPFVQTLTPSQEATSYSYYVALGGCIANNMKGGGGGDFTVQVSEGQDPNPSEWFTQDLLGNTRSGYVSPGATKMSCPDIATAALNMWGWGSNYGSFLQSMGYKYSFNTSTSVGTYAETYPDSARLKNFQLAVQAHVYNGAAPSLSGAAKYALASDAFLNGGSCSAKDLGPYTSLNSAEKLLVDNKSTPSGGSTGSRQLGTIQYNKVNKIDSSGSSSIDGYTYLYTTSTVGSRGTSSPTTVQQITYGYEDSPNQSSCESLVNQMNQYAPSYMAWFKANTGKVDSSNAKGCSGSASACAAAKPSCDNTVTGIGWILCPVLNALGTLDDAMWNIVSALLNVSPLQQSDKTYQVWGAFRTLANVALIIIFLIIIFSQLTGQGVSNYGVKKTLPRLIIAAVLINVSYIFMQVCVDVFNVLGSSIYNLINGVIGSPSVPSWQSFMGVVAALGVGGAAAAIGFGAVGAEAIFFLALPAALAAVIGFLAAIAVLVLRQALIPILAVLAPLAFVAYLLPNTKSWFDKWRGALIAMLMVYPFAAVLFAGAKMAAVIINGENGQNAQWWQTLVALIVLGVPLFLLPFIARQTNPMLAKLGNSMSNRLSRAAKPINDWAGDRKKAATARTNAKSPGRFNVGGKIRRGFQTRAAVRKTRQAANEAQHSTDLTSAVTSDPAKLAKGVNGATGQAYLKGVAARAAAEERKQATVVLEEDVAKARVKGDNTDDLLMETAINGATNAERSAAMHMLASNGRDVAIRELQKNSNVNQETLQDAIVSNAGSLIGKAPDLVKTPGGAFTDDLKADEVAGWSAGTAKAYTEYLATQPAEKQAAMRESLDSAIRKISTSPILQGKFSAKAAKNLRDVTTPGLIPENGDFSNPGPTADPSAQAATDSTPAPAPDPTPTPQGDAYDQRNAERAPTGPPPEIPEEWQNWHREQAERDSRFVVNPDGGTSVKAPPQPQNARDSQEAARAQAVANAKAEQQRSAANRGSTTDEHGRTTPDGASEDYQDRMNR